MSTVNPYKPPVAPVDDVASRAADAGAYIEGGHSVGAGQGWAWITGGFDLFKGKPGAWILIVVVLGALFFAMALVPLLGSLATVVVYPIFAGGIMLGCHAQRQSGTIEVGHVFAGFRNRAGDLLVVGVISLVAWIVVMIPVMLIIGSSVFFGMMQGNPEAMASFGMNFLLAWLVALALSIPVYMALWFAPALVVLRETAPVEALKQSFRGCLKNIVPFLIYGVVMLVLGVIAVIPIGLGLLVLLPVLMGSVYVAYEDIYFER